MGARLKVAEPSPTSTQPVRLDVRSDRQGEFFELQTTTDALDNILVLDVQPTRRHLLMLARDGSEKSKFLCGHDERHWFVAGIPEAAPVGTVSQAMMALKPMEVREAETRSRLKRSVRDRRKNAAFLRQGEWFFLPEPSLSVDPKLVLQNEPLRRGFGSKPHVTEFLYRTGGELVYVCRSYPNGVTEAKYRELLGRKPRAKNWGWRTMRRNPGVYVRGRVRHADHATIVLPCWHRVVMNTEGQSRAMQHVAFLD